MCAFGGRVLFHICERGRYTRKDRTACAARNERYNWTKIMRSVVYVAFISQVTQVQKKGLQITRNDNVPLIATVS